MTQFTPKPKTRLARILRIWCGTTDNGSDITAAADRIQGECEKAGEGVYCVKGECLNHQQAIIALEQLHSMNVVLEALKFKKGTKYYSLLAKTLHLMRTHARKFYDEWEVQATKKYGSEELGKASAKKYAKKTAFGKKPMLPK